MPCTVGGRASRRYSANRRPAASNTVAEATFSAPPKLRSASCAVVRSSNASGAALFIATIAARDSIAAIACRRATT
jgi:hypothetical protein